MTYPSTSNGPPSVLEEAEFEPEELEETSEDEDEKGWDGCVFP